MEVAGGGGVDGLINQVVVVTFPTSSSKEKACRRSSERRGIAVRCKPALSATVWR